MTKAREIAAEYLNNTLVEAFEALDLDTIQENADCDLEEAMSILFEIGSATVSVMWEDGGCDCCDDDMDVLPGDPDPTIELGEDYTPCAETDGKWMCTREDGHDGMHVAGDGTEVCAVWL